MPLDPDYSLVFPLDLLYRRRRCEQKPGLAGLTWASLTRLASAVIGTFKLHLWVFPCCMGLLEEEDLPAWIESKASGLTLSARYQEPSCYYNSSPTGISSSFCSALRRIFSGAGCDRARGDGFKLRVDSDQMWGRNVIWWRWWKPGTGCPERW